MKKFTKVIALTVVAIMALAVSASASVADDIGFKMVDPVSYEAKLADYGTDTVLELESSYNAPGNMAYVSEATPFGTKGYLSHKYDANTSNASSMFTVGVGNGVVDGVADGLKARLPGNLGKQKIEVIFRLDDVGNVTGLADNVLDIRNFFIKNDGKTGVIGMKVGYVNLGYYGRYDSDESDKSLGMNFETKKWYRFVIVEDLPAGVMNFYMEKWNDTTNKFEIARDAIQLSAENRTCTGRNVYCFTNGVRVRLSNLMSWDIAQIKITRDNTLVYSKNPNDYTTGLNKVDNVKTGIDTVFMGNNNTTVSATAYVAGNAFGLDGGNQPTSWYTYEDGTYLPRTTNPVLIAAQYDANGNLVAVNTATASISTTNAGYRGGNYVDSDPSATPTADGEYNAVMQHSLDFKKLELSADKHKNSEGEIDTASAKYFLWNDFSGMVPLTDVIEKQ